MHRTIPSFLDAAVRDRGDRSWLRTDYEELTYAEAAAAVGVARERLREAGVAKGDHVLLTARAEPRYLLALLAVAALGATAVPVNPRSTTAELAGLLAQLRTGGRLRAVVTDETFSAEVAGGAAVIDVDELTGGTHDGPVVLDSEGVAEDDIAVLMPSSGTTGRSKLVMQTHRMYVLTGEGFAHWLGLTEQDRLLTCLPLFHTNAMAYSVMGSIACGGGLSVLPRFSASSFLDDVRRHGATSFNAVGAVLEGLLAQPRSARDRDHELRVCYAAPSPAEQRHREIEARFGFQLTCGYGMSESTYGLVWSPGTKPYGTLGHPRQHPSLGEINEVRVVDAHGADLPVGETGELLLRNPAVTPGYFGMTEETAAVLVDGWLHTGDLVTRNEDGTFTFSARLKEVIRRKGENLAPAEVEEVLRTHPGVADCAVTGVAVGMSEEDVKAFVVRADSAEVPAEELRDWVGRHLARFKVPRYWQFVSEIPRTPTGRIARHRLPGPDDRAELDLERAKPGVTA